MVDETKRSWPIEPIQDILTRIRGPIVSTADKNNAYNRTPLDKPSQRLTNFVIAGQQYCFKRLFYGISIGPAPFSSFMISIFKPLIRKNKIITYLDDVFIQDTTTDTKSKTLTHYQTTLEKENLKAAPDKPFFFLDSVKFLGHQLQNTHIQPLKSKTDRFLKLQPPKNKKEIQNYVGYLKLISKYIYNLRVILRPFYHQLRDTTDFKWTPELQQTFDRVKKEATDGTLRLAIPNSEKSFYILCDASNYGTGAALLQKNQFGKMESV